MNKSSFLVLQILILLFLFSLTTQKTLSSQPDVPTCGTQDLPSCVPTNLSSSPTYKFTNPPLANKILTKLDTFFPIKEKYLGIGKNAKTRYQVPFLGLKNDEKYCTKHRRAFVENPDMIFAQKNIFVENREETLMKGVNEIGTHAMPKISTRMPAARKASRKYAVKPDIGLFFSSHSMHRFKHLGMHFGCFSQEVNHIPGHHVIKMKDQIAVAANKYAKKFQKRPQCFNFDQYFPMTWLLHEKKSCNEFFSQLKTAEHQKLLDERKIVYIQKVVNSHRGVGITPLSAEKEALLRQDYKEGKLCGKLKKELIVQNYVHNPLLLEGRKFDFRMYMLVGSTNPLMVFYHDGFLRVSLFEYDANSEDKQVLLTNLALNKAIHDKVKAGELYEGLDEEGLKHKQQWDFERLQAYLLSVGAIKDPNWLDNYLRPEFKKAMIHLARMSYPSYLKRSNVYELYGVDFILDSDMKLWFIEANAGPSLSGYSVTLEKHILKMVKDHFEIVFGLLKSRMKRVMTVVNKIIEGEKVKEKKNGDVMIVGLKNWRKEFREAVKNKFEPEFKPSFDNGFSKIIDMSLSGAAKYDGLIAEACF